MKKTLLVFVATAAIVASTAVFVGIKHNPMGEFCIGNDLDNCRIDLLYTFQLWFFWFFPVFLFQTGLFYMVNPVVA